jgi:hypothetical protein
MDDGNNNTNNNTYEYIYVSKPALTSANNNNIRQF